MALFKRSCYKKKVKEEEVVLVRGRERECVCGGGRGGNTVNKGTLDKCRNLVKEDVLNHAIDIIFQWIYRNLK